MAQKNSTRIYIIRKFFALFLSFFVTIANAEAKKQKNVSCSPHHAPSSLVIDARTGKILHAENARKRIYPASLTKLMSLYLTFEAIEKGKLSLNQKIYVSANAEKMPPTKLGLKEGEYITVKDAILGAIIKSANDASVALAEAISGSEAKFARLMNSKAHSLGMQDTSFYNASGWHHPQQKTTALDIVKLSIALKKNYPNFYPLFAKTKFEFRGKLVKGHNKVVENYIGAEGLKTGFTCPSGFNLAAIASRGHTALAGVVIGNKSAALRDKKMTELLDKHFGVINQPIKTKVKVIKTAEHQKLNKKRIFAKKL